LKAERIIISRTDNIGDVILTLPMATVIKNRYPDSRVIFMGKPYTRAIIERCAYVDEYVNWEEIRKDARDLNRVGADLIIHVFNNREVARAARTARIKYRLATSHRLYNLWTCNRFVHFSRRKSDLHEAQLNLKMLTPLGINTGFTRPDIVGLYGWKELNPDCRRFKAYFNDKFNLILHMKSYGNAKEWPAGEFLKLAELLPHDRFNLLITGTEPEGAAIRKEIPGIFTLPHVTDVTGKFDIDTFFDFIQCSDGLLSCSTGPLHIAAATGVRTLGLFPSARPKHAGRWGPLGKKAAYLEDTNPMDAPLNIPVQDVFEKLMKWTKNR
jgi:ADP-heptose:LPS heptosyltransferase